MSEKRIENSLPRGQAHDTGTPTTALLKSERRGVSNENSFSSQHAGIHVGCCYNGVIIIIIIIFGCFGFGIVEVKNKDERLVQ